MGNGIPVTDCPKCRGVATLFVFIPPLGNAPGTHVFQCVGCMHNVWSDLLPQPPPQGASQPSAQQQQQEQPDDEPKGRG